RRQREYRRRSLAVSHTSLHAERSDACACPGDEGRREGDLSQAGIPAGLMASAVYLPSPGVRGHRIHLDRSCLIALEQQVRCVPAAVIIRVDRLTRSLQSADDIAGFDGTGAET